MVEEVPAEGNRTVPVCSTWQLVRSAEVAGAEVEIGERIAVLVAVAGIDCIAEEELVGIDSASRIALGRSRSLAASTDSSVAAAADVGVAVETAVEIAAAVFAVVEVAAGKAAAETTLAAPVGSMSEVVRRNSHWHTFVIQKSADNHCIAAAYFGAAYLMHMGSPMLV